MRTKNFLYILFAITFGIGYFLLFAFSLPNLIIIIVAVFFAISFDTFCKAMKLKV